MSELLAWLGGAWEVLAGHVSAAWVQALGSVGAILYAGYLARAQAKQQVSWRREEDHMAQVETIMRLKVLLNDSLSHFDGVLKDSWNGRPADVVLEGNAERFQENSQAIRSLLLHNLRDPGLVVTVLGAANAIHAGSMKLRAERNHPFPVIDRQALAAFRDHVNDVLINLQEFGEAFAGGQAIWWSDMFPEEDHAATP